MTRVFRLRAGSSYKKKSTKTKANLDIGKVKHAGFHWYIAGIKRRRKYFRPDKAERKAKRKALRAQSKEANQITKNNITEDGSHDREVDLGGGAHSVPLGDGKGKSLEVGQAGGNDQGKFSMCVHFSVRLMMSSGKNNCRVLSKWKTNNKPDGEKRDGDREGVPGEDHGNIYGERQDNMARDGAKSNNDKNREDDEEDGAVEGDRSVWAEDDDREDENEGDEATGLRIFWERSLTDSSPQSITLRIIEDQVCNTERRLLLRWAAISGRGSRKNAKGGPGLLAIFIRRHLRSSQIGEPPSMDVRYPPSQALASPAPGSAQPPVKQSRFKMPGWGSAKRLLRG